MGKRFFTSDWHLNSSLIIKYANRYWNGNKSIPVSGLTLVDNCNAVAGDGDVVIHCGDFCLKGFDRHDDEIDDATGKPSAEHWLKSVRANLFLLSGNHDDGHSDVESMANSMYVDLNQNWRNVFVSHYPSYHKFYRGPHNNGNAVYDKMVVVLCGHVHDKWILFYDKAKNVLNVNVGVDVWNFTPVSDVQLTELLDFVKDAKVKMPQNSLTTDELLAWREMNQKHIEADRIFRKQARYAKKCLTPEECQRRKEAAMRAKGLDPNFKKAKKEKKEAYSFTHEDAVQFGVVPPDVIDSPSEF